MSKPVQLYAAVHVREFPAQALLRFRPNLRANAVAVIDGEPPLQTVCALNAHASRIGVAGGMTTVELETFPTLAVLSRSASEERSAEAALLECADTFSPRVEQCGESNAFGCVMDITGSERLLGSPETIGETLLQRARALGFSPSVALSSNLQVAICLTRFLLPGSREYVLPGQERLLEPATRCHSADVSRALRGVDLMGCSNTRDAG